ncbi:cytochrome P450 [Streptomyces sp. cmx-4-9]|uniref:cytochrome P450 n=1 Tax=Streptomyces sp. cmx-4-9 TaxID=2790941 RepID=UPI00397F6E61
MLTTDATGAGASTGREIDLFSQEFAADPFPVYSRLRSSAPVHYDPATRLWLVSRDEDIRKVLLDSATYRNDNALRPVLPLRLPALRIMERVGFNIPPALFNNSGDSHAGLRGIVLRMFSAQRVREALPMIERVTAEELDLLEAALEVEGRCDVASTAARTIPIRVMLEMLGIAGLSEVDTATVAEWTDAFITLFWGRTDKDEQRLLAGRASDFYAWLCDLAELREVPDGSLLAALAAHRMPDGSPMTRDEIVAICSNLLVAGHVTTSQMISTALCRALESPDEWQALQAGGPERAEAFVEETLRREPSLTAWRRITSRETTLNGVELPADAELLLLLTSAGTDPEAFEDPEGICPFRDSGRQHLGFGLGRHRCPGAELARAEGRVFLDMAARRFPNLRAADADGPPFLELVSFRAPSRLLVAQTDGK